MARLALLALSLAGCASQYAYTFQVTDPAPRAPEVVEDADVRAHVAVDPDGEHVVLELANKTDQVLQVAWPAISLRRPDGAVTTLHPDADLGWIPPNGSVSARLFPVALPRSGGAAAANEGQAFELDVPVLVRRESRTYKLTLTAHVHEL